MIVRHPQRAREKQLVLRAIGHGVHVHRKREEVHRLLQPRHDAGTTRAATAIVGVIKLTSTTCSPSDRRRPSWRQAGTALAPAGGAAALLRTRQRGVAGAERPRRPAQQQQQRRGPHTPGRWPPGSHTRPPGPPPVHSLVSTVRHQPTCRPSSRTSASWQRCWAGLAARKRSTAQPPSSPLAGGAPGRQLGRRGIPCTTLYQRPWPASPCWSRAGCCSSRSSASRSAFTTWRTTTRRTHPRALRKHSTGLRPRGRRPPRSGAAW